MEWAMWKRYISSTNIRTNLCLFLMVSIIKQTCLLLSFSYLRRVVDNIYIKQLTNNDIILCGMLFGLASIFETVIHRYKEFIVNSLACEAEIKLFHDAISLSPQVVQTHGALAGRIAHCTINLPEVVFSIVHESTLCLVSTVGASFLFAFVNWVFVVVIIAFTIFSVLFTLLFVQFNQVKALNSKVHKLYLQCKSMIYDRLSQHHLLTIYSAHQNDISQLRVYEEECKYLKNQVSNHQCVRLLLLRICQTIAILGTDAWTIYQVVFNNNLSAGTLLMVHSILTTCCQQYMSTFQNMLTSWHKFSEVRQTLKILRTPDPLSITTSCQLPQLVVNQGSIQFSNVGFTYPNQIDKVVFRNLNITIPAGQKVGIVGSSGSGKTSLFNLLLRLFDVSEGSILIDGQNIANCSINSVRDAFGTVPQVTSVIFGTIQENVAYGSKSEWQNEKYHQAIDISQCTEFIQELPNNHDTMIGISKGTSLSGGQLQRLNLARVLYKPSKLLLLDEPTSALDVTTELKLKHQLMQYVQSTAQTILMIAHRISTIMEMDRILVFDNGKIIQDGSPEVLLQQTNGPFAKMYALSSTVHQNNVI